MQPQLHTPGRLHSLLQISKCFASALFAIPFFQYSQHRGSIAHLPRVWPKSQVYQHLTPIFIPKTAGCVNNDHTCCMKLTCAVAASFFPLPCIYSCKLAFRFASDHPENFPPKMSGPAGWPDFTVFWQKAQWIIRSSQKVGSSRKLEEPKKDLRRNHLPAGLCVMRWLFPGTDPAKS